MIFEREAADRPGPLIVSYSYSGNTHKIAQELERITGGDWLEIHPWQPYPAAFTQLLKQVKREIRTGYRPRLLPMPCSPQQYKVVLVGSPNWCGTIAPPLASWLYKNDLAGKTILPFYSHCGGALGELRGDIEKLCPKSRVLEALGVIDGGGGDLENTLAQWLERAGAGQLLTCAAGEGWRGEKRKEAACITPGAAITIPAEGASNERLEAVNDETYKAWSER